MENISGDLARKAAAIDLLQQNRGAYNQDMDLLLLLSICLIVDVYLITI
ncbi:MAG: hypothetical protein R3B93_06155 [Bacteroidia bacterium]